MATLAKVVDGGITSAGDAWMVMERVGGVTIDTHCAAAALMLRYRIELAIAVDETVAERPLSAKSRHD